jgi:uncharacterized short protein YbdD (DUF466 family)
VNQPGRKPLRQFLSSGLSLLRGVTGDDAYEKYLAHMRTTAAAHPPMSEKEFFRAQMEQKWSCVSGCC